MQWAGLRNSARFSLITTGLLVPSPLTFATDRGAEAGSFNRAVAVRANSGAAIGATRFRERLPWIRVARLLALTTITLVPRRYELAKTQDSELGRTTPCTADLEACAAVNDLTRRGTAAGAAYGFAFAERRGYLCTSAFL